jgi:hypothetical protein
MVLAIHYQYEFGTDVSLGLGENREERFDSRRSAVNLPDADRPEVMLMSVSA